MGGVYPNCACEGVVANLSEATLRSLRVLTTPERD